MIVYRPPFGRRHGQWLHLSERELNHKHANGDSRARDWLHKTFSMMLSLPKQENGLWGLKISISFRYSHLLHLFIDMLFEEIDCTMQFCQAEPCPLFTGSRQVIVFLTWLQHKTFVMAHLSSCQARLYPHSFCLAAIVSSIVSRDDRYPDLIIIEDTLSTCLQINRRMD